MSRFLDELEKEFGSSGETLREREPKKQSYGSILSPYLTTLTSGADTPEDGPPMTAYQNGVCSRRSRGTTEGLESTVLSRLPEARSAEKPGFLPAFVGPDSCPPSSIIEAAASPVTG